MSRKGNALGNRLGISKDWTSHFGYYKQGENIKRSFFIRSWLIKMLEKLSIWVLNMRVVQKKNVLHIHVLMNYLNSDIPMIQNGFFSVRFKDDWYWEPFMISFLKVPRRPRSEKRSNLKKRTVLKYYDTIHQKQLTYRQFYLQFVTTYLEDKLIKLTNFPIKLYLYNVIDYYESYNFNVIITYVKHLISLFWRDQKRLSRGIKTSLFYLCLGIIRKNSYLIAKSVSIELSRNRRTKQFLNFLFKIIRELFYMMPLTTRKGKVQRAEYLKIQISGKIGGKMRASKKIYSFSTYKGKEIPLQTYKLKVDYCLIDCYTYAGVLGIKVWVC